MSIDAQRDAAESYIASQKGNGWICLPERYDDYGYSGGNLDRPALQRLKEDIMGGKIDMTVTYRLDRLSRSLLDFGVLQKFFEKYQVSFCSVTQQIDTSTSAGKMMLNILMSFSEYERVVIAERTRDKMAEHSGWTKSMVKAFMQDLFPVRPYNLWEDDVPLHSVPDKIAVNYYVTRFNIEKETKQEEESSSIYEYMVDKPLPAELLDVLKKKP